MLDGRLMAEGTVKVRALGTEVDSIGLGDAVARILAWIEDFEKDPSVGHHCRYVVTPNLDHAVMLQKNIALRDAYKHAALVLPDGMPLVWASRIFGQPLKERVAGSDLVPALFSAAPPGTRVFLLGAQEESSESAAANVARDYPHLHLVGRLSPPLGFEHDADWSDKIVGTIQSSKAQLIVVGFGAPKQELWVHRHMERMPKTVAICAGATIDFLANKVERAPAWTHQLGLEWVHRLLSDPKRLAKRYAKDAFFLPGLLASDLRHFLSSRS